jgi:predicted lipoprotein with Yx(FWY)xxD motif
MKTSTLAWIVLILLVLVGGWYVWMQSAVPAPASPVQNTLTQNAAAPASTTPGTANPGAIQNNLTLGLDGTTTLGKYLIAYNGITLYTFAKDSTGTSTCYGGCAQTWPPYTVPAGMQLNIEDGVSNAKAGTIVRADGTTQLTYGGMPLYFYSGDQQSGDTNGQGIGRVWYVVKP